MFSQKKLNTYGVESPCECLPRVARYARQPWAIKRTTRTELRGENIRHGGFIHGNAGIISTVLRFFNFISCQKEDRRKGCLQN